MSIALASLCADAAPEKISFMQSAVVPSPFVIDGTRATFDLGGIWEARPGEPALVFPPPTAGWKPHTVPHYETNLLDSDGVGQYFVHTPDNIFQADGKTPKRADKLAAWFRRSFTVDGPIPDGAKVLLQCDGIAWYSELWLNGVRVGNSVLGTAPNTYDVTAALRAGDNQLVIGVAGRVRLWDSERKTFIAPFTGPMPGIYDEVRLELVSELRIDDIFVRTSVEKKRIEVDLTLVNDGQTARTVTPVVTIIDPNGVAQLSIAVPSITVAPGKTQTVTPAADWLAPLLWTPGTPNLYRAVAELRQGNAVADRLATTFGFREFAAKGRDFLLNGRRQVLLRNSWLTGGASDRRELALRMVRDETSRYNCIRQHLGFINPHVIAQADASGMMVIPEFWGFYQNSNKSFPISQADAWVPNTVETMQRLVKRYRNHPSVIMWSITNETFWNSEAPEHMAVAERLIAGIKAVDPTRLLQADAGVSYGGRLPAINIHYPEGSSDISKGEPDTVGRLYENSGWVVPNDFAWLKKEGVSRAWRSSFTWDRPLMIGEFYARDGDEPERYTPYTGDASYDHTAWRWQDFGGRDALPTRNNPWIDMVKMSCDHYRAAGVACLNPWTGSGPQLMPPLLVAPLNYHPTAFGGEDFPRRFVVINDHNVSEVLPLRDIHLQAGLLINGREVWSERRIPAHVEPGESKEVTITVKAPAVASQMRGRLIVRMMYMRGPWPVELCRHEEDMWIAPRASLADIDPKSIALVDAGDGPTAKALASLGLPLQPSICDDAALAGKRVLVIGENAAAKADLSAVARFAERGGQVLVLHQKNIDQFVPGQPEIDAKHAASFSWRSAKHPILAGLDDEQLRFWRPDHLVVTESLVRPSVGAAAPLAASGGRYGMHWSPLVELRHGKGTITFCQYLLTERVAVEPAAGRILSQAIRAALAVAPSEPAPALRLAEGVSKETRAMLSVCNVRTSDGLEGTGPVLVNAATPPNADVLKRLRTEVEGGRVLWLRGLDEKTAPAIAAILPWKPSFAPLAKGTVGVIRRVNHPLIAGLGSGDFYWARGNEAKATTPIGGPVLAPPTLDAAVLLTEPALLVAVPLGKGWVLVDQLAWDKALAPETERATRIVSCLARNAGAGFLPPVGRRYQFSYINLAKFANRGYLDEKAGDGVGGWTDQGDNDMRFFLVNHAGTVGGMAGMAVAGESFPTQIKFQGITYQLTDPKVNDGKAVLTLRGGPNDPNAPSEARGIPVGGVKADRLWFLHTACWGSAGGYGVEVARYEVVYADGSHTAAPVRQGQEISDWWNPMPLAGAQVVWTGCNPKTAPIGIYSMPWDNPNPDKPIASIDVVGNIAQTQLVLLAVTLGVEDQGGAQTIAAWDCGAFADGSVPAHIGGGALTGEGTPTPMGSRRGLRLANGQALYVPRLPGPLAEGLPVALEIEVAPDGKPGGHLGGLMECGQYMASGVRMMILHDLKVVIEHYAGQGAEKATYLQSREPLPLGRFSTVRYEHDGKQARLLIDGNVQEVKDCPPPAPWKQGLRIGVAGGKDYWFNGVVGNVRIQYLGNQKINEK
jgi:beta-galactosidase